MIQREMYRVLEAFEHGISGGVSDGTCGTVGSKVVGASWCLPVTSAKRASCAEGVLESILRGGSEPKLRHSLSIQPRFDTEAQLCMIVRHWPLFDGSALKSPLPPTCGGIVEAHQHSDMPRPTPPAGGVSGASRPGHPPAPGPRPIRHVPALPAADGERWEIDGLEKFDTSKPKRAK